MSLAQATTAVAPERASVAAATRVVIKLGTSVVMRDDGAVAVGRLYSLIESIAALRRANREVVLVSSGAVGLGVERLALPARPTTLPMTQACAAVGQSRLMALYEHGFEHFGVVTAQVLLTEDDFTAPDRARNLKATLTTLLSLGAVPIVNENDAVATTELERPDSGTNAGAPRRTIFGDNDKLSALVALPVAAELLLILSDVDGLYTAHPMRDPGARLVPTVRGAVPDVAPERAGARGRGGIVTKLEAARIAMDARIPAVVANGREPHVIDRVCAGEVVGTVFLPADPADPADMEQTPRGPRRAKRSA